MAPRIIAYRLRKERKRRGLTQRGAARLLGITPTQLGEYEYGKRMPSEMHLRRISALYHTLSDSLYYERWHEAVEFVRENIKKYGPDGTGIRDKPPN